MQSMRGPTHAQGDEAHASSIHLGLLTEQRSSLLPTEGSAEVPQQRQHSFGSSGQLLQADRGPVDIQHLYVWLAAATEATPLGASHGSQMARDNLNKGKLPHTSNGEAIRAGGDCGGFPTC